MKALDQFFERLFRLITDHPWPVLLLVLLATIAAATQLPKIKIDASLRTMLPHDQVYRDDEFIRKTFGIEEFLIIGIRNQAGAFDVATLTYLRDLTRRLEVLPGIYKVRSLFSEDNIVSTPERSLKIAPFLYDLDARSIAEARRQLENFPVMQGVFVSSDFTIVTALVEVAADVKKSEIERAIRETLKNAPPPAGATIHLSGAPIFEGVMGRQLIRDLTIMIPVIAAVILVFLYITYRSFVLMALCAFIIFAVDVWTLGFMARLNMPFHIIQCVMPVILMALSVADEIHIFSRYYEGGAGSNAPHKENILNAMQEMWRPVVLTSITTACGFLALSMTSMEPLRYFGLFTAFGIMCAMVFALLATPAVLVLFGQRERFNTEHRLLNTLLARLGAALHRYPGAIVFILIGTVVFSAAGIRRVYLQDYWIGNFKPSSTVYLDDALLNRELAGTNIIYLTLDSGAPDGIKNPSFLRSVLAFQRELESLGYIGNTMSLAKALEKLHRELTGAPGIPDSQEAIAQYLLLLDGSTYQRFWDFDYQKINIIIFSKKGDYITGNSLLPFCRRHLERLLPGITPTFGGEAFLSRHWVHLARADQFKSFFTAVVFILLVSSAVFWSVAKGIAVTSPILLAVAVNYGIMGFCDMPLSVSVSIFSSIIMGIGIDYAIHLQHKFDMLSPECPDDKILPGICATAGKAIVWNAVVVIAGFLTLLFSSTPPNQKLGITCSMGVLTSLGATFLVVPLLFRWTKRSSLSGTPSRPDSDSGRG